MTNTLAWPAWPRDGSTAITARASRCTIPPPGADMTACLARASSGSTAMRAPESTIEALMALQAVSTDPVAQRYVAYKPQQPNVNSWQVLEAETAAQVKGDPVSSYKSGQSTGEAQWSNGHYIAIGPNDAFMQQFSVPAAGKYYLYTAYLRQSAAGKEFTAEVLHAPAPPTIDGDLGDWSAAQPLSATSTANIVRGAAGWGGADKDAFVGYLMWDETNLYVAARVFDPEHSQTETGPSVWKGDTLWVYLDTNKIVVA